MERKYYLAEPDGKSMAAIKEWLRLRDEAVVKVEELTKAFGAKPEILRGNETIHGFVFDNDPGRAWKPIRDHKNCYAPDKRHKEGKLIAKQIDAIRIPHNRVLAELIGGGFLVVCGNFWGSISFQTSGDNYILSVPIPDKTENEFIPPDARLLKMSEYHAMKEAAEEAQKAEGK